MGIRKYKILIVDDNPSFIKAFEVLIKAVLGAELDFIDVAYNGIEAIEKVNLYDYNYVFMDVNMPVMDGLVATRIINSRSGRFVRIIAVSFNNDFQTVADMLKSGARNYINKANISYDTVAKFFENEKLS